MLKFKMPNQMLEVNKTTTTQTGKPRCTFIMVTTQPLMINIPIKSIDSPTTNLIDMTHRKEEFEP